MQKLQEKEALLKNTNDDKITKKTDLKKKTPLLKKVESPTKTTTVKPPVEIPSDNTTPGISSTTPGAVSVTTTAVPSVNASSTTTTTTPVSPAAGSETETSEDENRTGGKTVGAASLG